MGEKTFAGAGTHDALIRGELLPYRGTVRGAPARVSPASVPSEHRDLQFCRSEEFFTLPDDNSTSFVESDALIEAGFIVFNLPDNFF
jgi:hypothetical protein